MLNGFGNRRGSGRRQGGRGVQGYLLKWMYLFKLLWSLPTIFLNKFNNSQANSDSKYIRVNHSFLICDLTVFFIHDPFTKILKKLCRLSEPPLLHGYMHEEQKSMSWTLCWSSSFCLSDGLCPGGRGWICTYHMPSSFFLGLATGKPRQEFREREKPEVSL